MKAIILCLFGAAAVNAAQIEIVNQFASPIWIGIQGSSNIPPLENGGFVLIQNGRKTVNAADGWEGRFWARTGCDSNTNHCDTGDCGNKLKCGGNGGAPPATFVEIVIRKDQNLDFYDVSLVDGFNIAATIEPVGGHGDCPVRGCRHNINEDCPIDLKLTVGNQTIGCKSDCLAYNTDEACCRGFYNTGDTCETPTSANYFKFKCPDAISYVLDDASSLHTCSSKKYRITFG